MTSVDEKEKFLKLLDDEKFLNEVRKKILGEISPYKEENLEGLSLEVEEKDMKFSDVLDCLHNLFSNQENKNKKSEKIIEENIKTIDILEKEKREEIENLNMELNNINKKIEWYKNSFDQIIDINRKYEELPLEIKESLSGIFKSETIMGFVACGVQGESIESLWDYIKDETKEEKYEGMESLKEIFNYLFNLYKLSNTKLDWQEIEIGDSFDTDEHIRHSCGKVSGDIVEIMLRGYENKKTGKIIKKSLVRVG